MKTSLKKYFSFVMVLVLVVVCLFSVNVKAAAESTVTYEITSATSVSTSGTAPEGSSATFKNTYTNNKQQITKGNSMTFTFDGFAGKVVTSVVLSMKSNKSAGAGTLAITAGNSTIASISSATTFNKWYNNKAYTTSFINIEVGLTNSAYLIQEGEQFKIVIAATTNSLYCQSVTITYSDGIPTDPKISIEGNNYVDLGSTLQLSATVENTSEAVSWSSSNESVATVDNNGLVTPKSVGVTTITATVNGAVDTLDIKVYPQAGTTLTIAEAIELCELTGTTNTPYAYSTTGFIESIDTEYNSEYNNISVTIGDGTNSIKAYRMASGSELTIGDKITVTGQLLNYGGDTPEFAVGCTYVEVVDETSETIKAALNNIESFMSLAYTYTKEEIVKEQLTEATLAYTGTTTTNMTGAANEAESVGLDPELFIVTSDKGNASNHIGLNKDGNFRLYAATGNGCTLTVTAKQKITSITIEFGSTVGAFTVNGVTGSKETTNYKINSNSFSIKNVTTGASTQVHINSINIELESTGTTTTTTYSDVDFRLRCGATQELANIENIEDYGVYVTFGDIERTYNSTNEFFRKEGGMCYSIISLGDVLNNKDRLTESITVRAFVVVDGITYHSENVKEYTLVSLIQKYYNEENIMEVEPLHDLFESWGLITE